MTDLLDSPAPPQELSDVELLRSLRWSPGTNGLATASRQGNVEAFASEVGADLRKRFGVKKGNADRFAARFPRYEAVARESYESILEPCDRRGVDASDPHADLVRTAALLDGLRRFGGRLTAKHLHPLWRDAWIRSQRLVATEAATPLAVVLSAEIVWSSGILFDGQSKMGQRRKEGSRRLIEELDARTDTDGTPHVDLLPVFPEWFSAIVRCLDWASDAGFPLWNSTASRRFDALVKAAATLTRADGRFSHSTRVDIRPVLRRAVKRSGLKSDSPARRLVLQLQEHTDLPAVPEANSKTSPQRIDRSKPAAMQSDWAKLTVCRSRWKREADLLAITHAAAVPAIEFSAFGRPVFAGDWGLRVRVDGEDVELSADWDAACWFSDRDADYLELEWSNDQGIVLCRQAMLTRGDHQLLLADAVSTPERPTSRIEIESTLPLAAGVSATARRPLREVALDTGGLSLRAFPLAMPMNRIESATGSFDAEPEQLTLRQTGTGGVYAPIVVDWHPRRRELAVDWRTLTVTENHRRLTQAEASAHRVRLGDRQLLIYRRLNASKAMRAVLGYHHGAESVVGRFTRKGEVDPLVLVEA